MAKKLNKTEQHKKAVLEALEKSLGIVTTACKQVGIGRTIFYQWVQDDPDFARAVTDIENVTLDFAESQLLKQIKEGNPTSIIFYLKTKGKKRGYIERKEVDDGTGGKTFFDLLAESSTDENEAGQEQN